MDNPNVFLEFLKLYGPPAGAEGPVRLCREVFGIEPDEWQARALRAYGRGDKRISIRACHGPGKTFVAAVCIWHQLITRFPQKTVVTAPSKGQLEDALMSEVLKLAAKLPQPIRELFEEKKNRIELRAGPDESFLSARTAREEKPEALQGVHCDDGWVLLVADEASGIAEAIYESAGGSMSGEKVTTLLLSNPTRSSGFFFDTQTKLRDMWTTIHVSAKDSPRVTDDFVEDMARRYGEDSNAYRIRVLGEFPLADLDTIIAYSNVTSAQERDITVPFGAMEVWGLDVARMGDDDNVLIRRNKLSVNPLVMVWNGKDLMQTVGKVKALYDGLIPSERPEEILVDAVGLGAGVADRLIELNLPARSINVSETASANALYRNVRTELWFRCSEWLASKKVGLPKACTCDECKRNPKGDHVAMLVEEMVAQRADFTSSGKLMAAPKKDMKKAIKRSPNAADALMLTFASEPTTLMFGSAEGGFSAGKPWGQAIERDISYV